MRRAQRLVVDLGPGPARRNPRPPMRREKLKRPGGGDHRLGRDAVPEVRRTPDDVALHQDDVGAEAGGPAGGLVTGRASPDHDNVGHARAARDLSSRLGVAGWGGGLSDLAARSPDLGRRRCGPQLPVLRRRWAPRAPIACWMERRPAAGAPGLVTRRAGPSGRASDPAATGPRC